MAQARSVPRFQDEQRDFIIQKLIEKDINKLTYREIVAEMCAKFPELAGRTPSLQAQSSLIPRVKKIMFKNSDFIRAERERLAREQRANVQIPEDCLELLEWRQKREREMLQELDYRLLNPESLSNDEIRKLTKDRRACGVEIDRLQKLIEEYCPPSYRNWDTASDVQIVDYDKPNFDDWDKSSGKEQPDGTEHAVSGDAVKKMEIDCPDDVRASHHVVAGLSPRLYPNLEQRNVTLSASPNDSAHTLEVPDLPCSVQ